MTPTLVLIEMQEPANTGGMPPIYVQPLQQRQPELANAWGHLRDVIESKVGHIPLYVMSLNSQGAVGAWSVGQTQHGLTWDKSRHLVENKQVQLSLRGPVEDSRVILVMGGRTFRHIAVGCLREVEDDDADKDLLEYDSQGAPIHCNDGLTFTKMVDHLTREEPYEERIRLFRQIDALEAMYDGRLPKEVDDTIAQLKKRLNDLEG